MCAVKGPFLAPGDNPDYTHYLCVELGPGGQVHVQVPVLCRCVPGTVCTKGHIVHYVPVLNMVLSLRYVRYVQGAKPIACTVL